MKLLVITPFYKPAYIYGGPANSIPALCEGLASLGCDVTVYTTNANGKINFDGKIPECQIREHLKVFYFNRELPSNYFISRELGNVCIRTIKKYDLVYISSNWAYPLLPSSYAARKNSVPYIISPRTSFMKPTWKGKHIKKWMYHMFMERSLINGAAALHYTTFHELRESTWLKLLPPNFIVPNPIELSRFDQLPARGHFRHRYNIPENDRLILYLGRVEQRKGLNVSLLAFSELTKSIPNSKFVIAGPEEDNYAYILKNMAVDLQVADRVIFAGYQNPSQSIEAFVDADLFLLTSYSENFGMAVVEAMASGLPVLVSDQVGVADYIRQSNSGVVVPLIPAIVADRLIDIASKGDGHCFEMGKNAKLAASEFAPTRVAGKMLLQFEGIVRSSRN